MAEGYTIQVVGPSRYAIYFGGVRTAYSGNSYEEAQSIVRYLEKGPRYKFTMVCPSCNGTCETTADHRIPEPHLQCSDCLMEKMEVVSLKVAKLEKVHG